MLVLGSDFDYYAEVADRELGKHVGLELEKSIDECVHLIVVLELYSLCFVPINNFWLLRYLDFLRLQGP